VHYIIDIKPTESTALQQKQKSIEKEVLFQNADLEKFRHSTSTSACVDNLST